MSFPKRPSGVKRRFAPPKLADGAQSVAGAKLAKVEPATELSPSAGVYQLRRSRKWRLIVRNLPFSATESELRDAFGKHGSLLEVVVPRSRKEPSRAAGFAFVQFGDRCAASAAMAALNGTAVGARRVAVDWAVPKDDYEAARVAPGTEQEKLRKMAGVKEEGASDGEEPVHSDAESDNASCSSENEQSEGDDIADEGSEGESEVTKKPQKKPRMEEAEKTDRGINEGRTLFVRNLSFDTSDDGLKKAFEPYGRLNYALVCKYKHTDHSKGSGFVQFYESSEAQTCLETVVNEPLVIDERQVFVCKALRRTDAAAMQKERLEKAPKDNRNLHLMRVSLIRPGTAAANSMSEADAKRRTNIDLANRQKIKNLHVFVSPTRLVMHNLPKKIDDQKLRSICDRAVADKSAKIKQCRVWRDLSQLDSRGVGKSKGFAFVEFAEHRHALDCLKKLNNTADIFTDEKRPIVEFSLENRTALNKQLARRHGAGDGANAAAVHTLNAEAERTKASVRSGKMKPLPSHVGEKRRHRPAGKQTGKQVPATKKKKGATAKSTRKERRTMKAQSKGQQSGKAIKAGGKVKKRKQMSVSKSLAGK